jgi:hypothetical protein
VSVAEELVLSLPEAYQQDDEVLRVIFGAVAPPVDAVIQARAGLLGLLTPATMPEGWLEWAIWTLGWPVVPGLSAYTNRQVLTKLPGWRANYGQEGVLEDVIATYTKASSTSVGVSVTLIPRKPIKGGFRIGKGRIGKGRIWNFFSNEEILVQVVNAGSNTWGAGLEGQLRGLLELFLPPWMTFELRGP